MFVFRIVGGYYMDWGCVVLVCEIENYLWMVSIVFGLCGLCIFDFLDDWEVWNCGCVEEVFKGVLDE